MQFLKGFFIFIGYALLVLIGLGFTQKFPQWFAPYLVANYPYLVLPVILLIIGGLLASSKNLRKVFVNIFREFYKNSQFLRVLVPKNKLTRLVFNIGFIFFWLAVWGFIIETYFPMPTHPNGDRLGYKQGTEEILAFFTYVPILFITPLLWFKNILNVFKKIKDIPNTFINAKKETKRRIKSTVKYLSKSNISDADELKKYADLRNQGIITEEEFQAKKEILLDL
tara:strand:+ start:1173 stop:1847 length:675 start_codon:yes stop_codon:yes gene_type:complete